MKAPARTDSAGAKANSRWQYCNASEESSTNEDRASEVTGFSIGVRYPYSIYFCNPLVNLTALRIILIIML